MTTFTIPQVHDDWYEDGVEDGENLWRLDFARGADEYQAQLSCRLAPGAVVAPCGWCTPATAYAAARLFLERDNRLAYGERWDYACASWDLTPDVAAGLLAADKALAAWFLEEYVDAVAALPNDRAFIRASWRQGEHWGVEGVWGRVAVEAKWAEVDAAGGGS